MECNSSLKETSHTHILVSALNGLAKDRVELGVIPPTPRLNRYIRER